MNHFAFRLLVTVPCCAFLSFGALAQQQGSTGSADPVEHSESVPIVQEETSPSTTSVVQNVSGVSGGVNTNWAFNLSPGTPAKPAYPHPFESDQGWGGGSYPQDLLDGYRACALRSGWDCGLAFTGGNANWGGQACGVRQATIDFGQPVQVSMVKVTHHGDDHVPKIYQIQILQAGHWVTVVNQQQNNAARCQRPPGNDPASTWTCMITDEFAPKVTSKVRYTFDNCPNANRSILGKSITHGWLYEFEAYRLP